VGGVSKKSRCQDFLNLAPNHLNFFFGLWPDLLAQRLDCSVDRQLSTVSILPQRSGGGLSNDIVFLPAPDVATITSLELVDFINEVRSQKAEREGLEFPGKKYHRLLHKNLLVKTSKVLGEKHSAKFLAQYKDPSGRWVKHYKFPRREACLMAMSYDYDAQARVFDRMDELEGRVNVNLMDFSTLQDMTVREMQNRVTLAERFSFEEHGQKGSGLMHKRKRDKKEIEKAKEVVIELSQLRLPGFDSEVNLIS